MNLDRTNGIAERPPSSRPPDPNVMPPNACSAAGGQPARAIPLASPAPEQRHRAGLLDASSVVSVDPAIVYPAPGQRAVDMDAVLKEMVPSLEQHGQILPGICYRHSEILGALMCGDGNHRLAGVKVLGMKFKTIVLEKAPTLSELRRLRVAIACKYRAFDKIDLGAELVAEKQELGCSQEQLAIDFQLSAGYVSKLIQPYESGVAELIAAMKAGDVIITAAPAIASLPEDQQRALIAKLAEMRAARKDKRPVKRDAVEKMVAALKGSTRKRKARVAKGKTPGGMTYTFGGSPEEMLPEVKKLSDALGTLIQKKWEISVLQSLLR